MNQPHVHGFDRAEGAARRLSPHVGRLATTTEGTD